MNFTKRFFNLILLFSTVSLLAYNNIIFSEDLDQDISKNISVNSSDLNNGSNNSQNQSLDDLDVFSDYNSDVASFLDNNEFHLTKSNVKPKELIDLLIETGAIDLFKEQLFLRTNPLTKRSLLDNQLFLFDKNYDSGKFDFFSHIFYEETSRMCFYPVCGSGSKKDVFDKDTCMQSYLALCQESLMCKLKDLEQEIKRKFGDFGIDCANTIYLLRNATAQERKAGFFFGFEWMPRKFNVRFKVPLYYLERNIYLTKKEIDALTCEFGESDMSENMKFARQHLISDQFGLGDSRLEVDYPIYEGPRDLWARLGGILTIPTACPIVKGLFGSTFDPVKCRPSVSFTELFDQFTSDATRQEAMKKALDLGFSALDGISSMLLDSSLGNNGHFGIGLKLRTKLPMRSFLDRRWLEKVSLKGNLFLEYMLPHKETRWFIQKCDLLQSQFAMRNFKDESKAAENLAFLEKTLIDKIFPYACDVQVTPGTIFIWEEKLAYESKKWGAHLGTDVWVQTRERFGNICASNSLVQTFDIDKAKMPWAYQWSLFGSLFFKPKKQKGDFYVGLNAEKILSSRGIGKPYKFTISLERNF